MKAFVGLFLLVCSSGCVSTTGAHMTGESHPRGVVSGTRLQPTDVRKLADEASGRHGRNLHDYKQPKISYDATKKRWFVYYEGNTGKVGQHFMLRIIDETGEVRFYPGQ